MGRLDAHPAALPSGGDGGGRALCAAGRGLHVCGAALQQKTGAQGGFGSDASPGRLGGICRVVPHALQSADAHACGGHPTGGMGLRPVGGCCRRQHHCAGAEEPYDGRDLCVWRTGAGSDGCRNRRGFVRGHTGVEGQCGRSGWQGRSGTVSSPALGTVDDGSGHRATNRTESGGDGGGGKEGGRAPDPVWAGGGVRGLHHHEFGGLGRNHQPLWRISGAGGAVGGGFHRVRNPGHATGGPWHDGLSAARAGWPSGSAGIGFFQSDGQRCRPPGRTHCCGKGIFPQPRVGRAENHEQRRVCQ